MKRYRGRFAPTPSGPLHLGSLYTALASYLQARCQGGAWLVRIDDLDTPRNVPGASTQILRQLEAHGLHWDEAPRYQSRHVADYADALETLRVRGLLYACDCTRAQLKQTALPGPDDAVYAGTCRERLDVSARHALRLRVKAESTCFIDALQQRQCRNMTSEVGDFVLRRADGMIAYQLACAVDEPAQGISEVVRGSDLLGSTFRQLYVQQALDLPHCTYLHLPVLESRPGHKLSKQNHAAALRAQDAARNLFTCLGLLGQAPPPSLATETPATILAWGVQNWRPQALPHTGAIALD